MSVELSLHSISLHLLTSVLQCLSQFLQIFFSLGSFDIYLSSDFLMRVVFQLINK